MSVYIKGMEMPSGCAECPLEMYYFNTGETRCRVTNKTLETSYRPTSYEKRDSDCPLIPVPDHGRLVDADALIKKTAENMDEAKKADNYDWWNACSVVGDFVMDAPTIIPADKEAGE